MPRRSNIVGFHCNELDAKAIKDTGVFHSHEACVLYLWLPYDSWQSTSNGSGSQINQGFSRARLVTRRCLGGDRSPILGDLPRRAWSTTDGQQQGQQLDTSVAPFPHRRYAHASGMTSAQTIEKQEIDRQLKALRQRQQRLAELSEQEAKRESMKFLVEAGIVTKQGKLAASYR